MKHKNKNVERKNRLRAHLLTRYLQMSNALKKYIRSGYNARSLNCN